MGRTAAWIHRERTVTGQPGLTCHSRQCGTPRDNSSRSAVEAHESWQERAKANTLDDVSLRGPRKGAEARRERSLAACKIKRCFTGNQPSSPRTAATAQGGAAYCSGSGLKQEYTSSTTSYDFHLVCHVINRTVGRTLVLAVFGHFPY